MTKSLLITIEIAPPHKGARAIIVSGAPDGEIPTIRSGVFADLHGLVNATWAELQRREPQVPNVDAAPLPTASASQSAVTPEPIPTSAATESPVTIEEE